MPAAGDAKDLTGFSFTAATNPGLSGDVVATISGSAIAATLPSGTDVSALVATFTTTGASVAISGTAQVSGTTANDFANPVTYHVTAADGSTRDYVAIVNVAPVVPKTITDFEFLVDHNPQLGTSVRGTINGASIAAVVPSGTDVTALVATFATTGASVAVVGVDQVSDTTANDFTQPVIYRVTASDGSTQDYTVTVTVASRAAKAITRFEFLVADNPGLGADVTARITGTSITATVPAGTSTAALIAAFGTTATTVQVGNTRQVTGVTPNNFAAPVAYRVTAADGTTQTYTVTVTVAARSAKAITSFAFLSADNPGLGVDVGATINGTQIAAQVPAGTSRDALIATFSASGASVAVGGTAQVSGTTVQAFTDPVVYRVTAADGSTQDYTVTVTVASRTAKTIAGFAFLSAANPALASDAVAVITGAQIAVTVPSATDVTALVATFQSTGAGVTVGGVVQTSGTSANSFASPVVYRVTAVDGSTQDYTATVTVAPAAAKAITDFALLSANNPGLASDVHATIAGLAIAATVPAGTDATALVATFQSTGTRVAIGATTQVSGATANNFSRAVTYRVTAANATTQDYVVTVTVAPRTAKAITGFGFLSAQNPGLSGDVTATITGTQIDATLVTGPDPTRLVATFATTGASVTISGAAQASGLTAVDFTHPVSYRVTAADGSFVDYTVTVTVIALSARSLDSFVFRSANNPGLTTDEIATITGTQIAVTVPSGTSPSQLIATFHASAASVTVGSTAQVTGTTANNFTNPVVYHVTAGDGSAVDFTVTVTVAARSAKELTSFRFLAANNPSLPADVIGSFANLAIKVLVTSDDLGPLIATFSTTGASVQVGNVTQVSGTTANSFGAPVTYRVTAADGTSQSYTVTVATNPRLGHELTDVRFLAANNPGLATDVIAVFSDSSDGVFFSAQVPFGTDVSHLIATFTTTGTGVTVAGIAQVSGTTANNFRSTLVYRVTGANAAIQDYAVTVFGEAASVQ
jgi:hypothetical protein